MPLPDGSPSIGQERPLAGVIVLDLSNVLAGPLATYFLALLGADVIKIERPGTGDLGRKFGCDPERSRALMGISFCATASGKRSVTLDLQTREGRAVFRRLAARADVVLENFRPKTMQRLGVGYDVLKEANPRLVYCAISGFGQDGPLSQRPAYDQIIQGMCGIMSLTGTPETVPNRAGFLVCDSSAAITAAMGVIAALFRARNTGRGAMIDLSMLESSMAMASWLAANALYSGRAPVPSGNYSQSAAPSGTFQTADFPINIVCNEDHHFVALCSVLGCPEIAAHEIWSDRHQRLARRDDLSAVLQPHLLRHGADHWDRALAAAGVPAGRILTLPEILAHPQLGERGYISDLPRSGSDAPVRVTGLGFRFAGEDLAPTGPPPRLGEHTDAVLADAGYRAEEIAHFRQLGAI